MSVVRLTIAYLGTRYCGWQRQPNGVSVQQRLEEALATLCSAQLRAIAAGRTDAGVHADGQEVQLLAPSGHPPPGEGSKGSVPDLPSRAWVHGLNQALPADIRVVRARKMPIGFDARRSCVRKRYRYRFWHGDIMPPHEALIRARLAPGVDLDLFAALAPTIEGTADFVAFAKTGGASTTTRRTVLRCELERWSSRQSDLVVEGPGFLRGMVRAIAGTLQEVARGRLSEAQLGALLSGAKELRANPHAPAHGLTLEAVTYAQAGVELYPAEAGSWALGLGQ